MFGKNFMKSDYIETKSFILDNTKVLFLIAFSICKHLQKILATWPTKEFPGRIISPAFHKILIIKIGRPFTEKEITLQLFNFCYLFDCVRPALTFFAFQISVFFLLHMSKKATLSFTGGCFIRNNTAGGLFPAGFDGLQEISRNDVKATWNWRRDVWEVLCAENKSSDHFINSKQTHGNCFRKTAQCSGQSHNQSFTAYKTFFL